MELLHSHRSPLLVASGHLNQPLDLALRVRSELRQVPLLSRVVSEALHLVSPQPLLSVLPPQHLVQLLVLVLEQRALLSRPAQVSERHPVSVPQVVPSDSRLRQRSVSLQLHHSARAPLLRLVQAQAPPPLDQLLGSNLRPHSERALPPHSARVLQLLANRLPLVLVQARSVSLLHHLGRLPPALDNKISKVSRLLKVSPPQVQVSVDQAPLQHLVPQRISALLPALQDFRLVNLLLQDRVQLHLLRVLDRPQDLVYRQVLGSRPDLDNLVSDNRRGSGNLRASDNRRVLDNQLALDKRRPPLALVLPEM